MKALAIISAFLILFSGSVGCFAQKPDNTDKPAANAAVAGDPFSWDFGRVKEGSVLKHDFSFKNSSEETLKILDINTSCGCTVSSVNKKVLLPGEETVIEVKFKTAGYLGATQQFVYVNTDSLDNPVLRFIIRAEVSK